MTVFNSFPITGVPISGLTNEVVPALTDIVPSVQSGVTYNLSLQQILSLFLANFSTVSSVIDSASSISLSTVTAANITSIPLTLGTWIVFGNVFVTYSISGTSIAGWSSSTPATQPDASLLTQVSATLTSSGISIPFRIYNITSNTTVYLSAQAAFGSGTATACGGIYALKI